MAVGDPLDLNLYDYELSAERIAQRPERERDLSRLLHLNSATGEVKHLLFRDIVNLLGPNDLLVANDTRVIPARILGCKGTGGRVEVLLLEMPSQTPNEEPVDCLVKGSKLKPGLDLILEGGLKGRLEAPLGRGRWRVVFDGPDKPWPELLNRIGRVPLPPYIKRKEAPGAASFEARRYQTVYAAHDGAVAAPTAGLHFTPALLAALNEKGVAQARVTLHIGYGTFAPLREHDLASGRLHAESFHLTAEAAQEIQRARRQGKRVVAVGTSTVRLLEHLALNGGVQAGAGRTELLIAPGFKFQVVEAMVTNLHLPKTSLILLVCAMAGRERILAAYGEAIELGYRFYSFGDAMFIER